jgi:FkbM family methyltransferase
MGSNNNTVVMLVAGAALVLLGFFLGRGVVAPSQAQPPLSSDAPPWQSSAAASSSLNFKAAAAPLVPRALPPPQRPAVSSDPAKPSYAGPRVAPVAVGSCPTDDNYLLAHAADLHGQASQDRFVFKQFFRGVCSRVYVEIGAYDGSLNSNTWFFNHHMGWRGILVEASPSSYEKARRNRPNDALYHRAITSESDNGYITFMFSDETPQVNSIAGFEDKRRIKGAQEIRVPTGTFREIFVEQGVTRVDFFSLDVEGGELVVLETIDFDAVLICVLMTENNPVDTDKNREVNNFMTRHNFAPRLLGQDTVWVNARCPEYHL